MSKRFLKGGLYCTWCSKPIGPETRGVFCCEACKHEYKIRTSHRYAREQVFKRDGGVCGLCGLDTVALILRLNGKEGDQLEAEIESLGIPKHRRTLWDMDHIVPVSQGGGTCGLNNYRTLCIWCHSEVTSNLNRRTEE